MSLRGPTPLTVVQLPGEQVQVQGVIQTAQSSSVIHSPQVQTMQVTEHITCYVYRHICEETWKSYLNELNSATVQQGVTASDVLMNILVHKGYQGRQIINSGSENTLFLGIRFLFNDFCTLQWTQVSLELRLNIIFLFSGLYILSLLSTSAQCWLQWALRTSSALNLQIKMVRVGNKMAGRILIKWINLPSRCNSVVYWVLLASSVAFVRSVPEREMYLLCSEQF